MVDQDGVILPRLRVRDVVRRGAVFGVIGVVPLSVAPYGSWLCSH
ncbi:DUF6336 family protein [Streptomyces sp. NPDC058914]